MATVMIHTTVTLDGFMAGPEGEIDWMFGHPTAPEDEQIIERLTSRIGAVVGGANRAQTIEEGEQPYGGALKVPVFLMTRTPRDPIEMDGTTYTFVVDDIRRAVSTASDLAGDGMVSLLGGTIARQCLQQGLVDEIHLHVVPVLLGEGIPLFAGLGQRVDLERIDTEAFAAEAYLAYRVKR